MVRQVDADNSETQSDLRLCPFCLSDFLSEDTNSQNAFCVFCHQCYCVGPPAPTEELAKEYWNYRGNVDFKLIKERDFYL